ncbi:MAG: SdiA-regulated domain-containing protein [Paracoccaceae bacterium]
MKISRRPVTNKLALAAVSFFLICGFSAVAIGQDNIDIQIRYLDSKRVLFKAKGLREPSGLALAAGGNHFWIVSDNASRIYRVGLDGKLDRSGTIKIRLSGPEGITEDTARHRLIVVSENNSEIVQINLRNGVTKRFSLRRIRGYVSNGLLFSRWGLNNGLEGVTVDPATGAVFVLKEKSPRLLLELSRGLSKIRSSTLLTAEMGFVDDRVGDDKLDVSGIVYDPRRRAFWIVSDTARRLFLFDPLTKKATSWPLTRGEGGRRLPNAEGVALSDDGDTLYIVNDDHGDSRLVSYEIIQR